ncbi:MAG: glycoside hydrolase family 127 protein [Proteobacteria bacterium]|nr:glycoside hydrolase family 127 protein [Pseudomonadota bacterium]
MRDLSGAARGRVVLGEFGYDGVRLLPGRFATQIARAREVYGAIPNDDILKGFRRAAGLPAPGNDLRGWCAKTSGVIFGQLLSGMARMSRATGDDALRQKAIALFQGWKETLGPEGNARMRLYEWDKLVCGLVDLWEFADYAAVRPVLEQTLAWAAKTFDRSRRLADDYDFWGAAPGGTSEWYTLPENLYRAYLISGNGAFKDFADLWRYEDYWRQFAETSELREVVTAHAYSHVNTFSSAAMAYAVSGDKRYLRICVNAYDFLQKTQCYATGGFGPDERLMPPDGRLGKSLDVYAGHAEIPCGTWAAFKLSRYLMGFTGEARFGDWIETALYNAIGAALPTESDGRTYYYGDYRISSGLKQYYWHEWPCCSGTYWQTVADYHNIIYFKDAEGLYVNLFVPSEATWQHQGQRVVLRQETEYPESEATTLKFDIQSPLRFKLRFRVPGWSSGAAVTLNSSALSVPAVPGQWATIEREWAPEDCLIIGMKMALRMVPVDRQHPDRVAVMFGPVVLAQDEACCRRPFAMDRNYDLTTRLIREGTSLRFRLVDTFTERHTRYLQPFYDFPAFWPYWVYFDISAPPLY